MNMLKIVLVIFLSAFAWSAAAESDQGRADQQSVLPLEDPFDSVSLSQTGLSVRVVNRLKDEGIIMLSDLVEVRLQMEAHEFKKYLYLLPRVGSKTADEIIETLKVFLPELEPLQTAYRTLKSRGLSVKATNLLALRQVYRLKDLLRVRAAMSKDSFHSWLTNGRLAGPMIIEEIEAFIAELPEAEQCDQLMLLPTTENARAPNANSRKSFGGL